MNALNNTKMQESKQSTEKIDVRLLGSGDNTVITLIFTSKDNKPITLINLKDALLEYITLIDTVDTIKDET